MSQNPLIRLFPNKDFKDAAFLNGSMWWIDVCVFCEKAKINSEQALKYINDDAWLSGVRDVGIKKFNKICLTEHVFYGWLLAVPLLAKMKWLANYKTECVSFLVTHFSKSIK